MHPIRLVVNADGFGSSTALNRGIVSAHQDGILTSTNLVGNLPDPKPLMETLQALPDLGVGIQLCLVAGFPVADPTKIPSLLDPEGAFHPRPQDFLLAWAKAALREEDLAREFDAQVTRLRDFGLHPDHLCLQHHLGFLPIVGQAAAQVAKRHRIEGLRTSVETPHLSWLTEAKRGIITAALSSLAWFSRRNMGALRHGPQTWGYFEMGRLDEIRILEIVGRLRSGHHELLCHPVWEDIHPDPHGERFALSSPRVLEALSRRGIVCCRWRDLY